jgi:pimeloyl-ACP methyl ester carboxylesterase
MLNSFCHGYDADRALSGYGYPAQDRERYASIQNYHADLIRKSNPTPRRLSSQAPHVLYVDESGSPDGLPVVFIHGGGLPGVMPPAAASSTNLYRIVTFDQRGCGRSAMPAENNITAGIDRSPTWNRPASSWASISGVLFGGSTGAPPSAGLRSDASRARTWLDPLRGISSASRRNLTGFPVRKAPAGCSQLLGRLPRADSCR